MKDRVVFFNGEFVEEKDAKISIYDSALMFGDMVFEMTRSFNKKQFKLKEHLERLYRSIKYLRIPIDISIEEMEKRVYQTIEMNDPVFEDDDEHRIMIDVTRGILSIYQETTNVHKGCNVIIADFPLRWTVSSMGPLYDTGINAVIPSQRTIPAQFLEPKVKNRSRIHYLMANMQVSQIPGDNNWALLLDPDGFIAEGTGDNFFIVKNGSVISPEPRNILRGISRDYIIELCEEMGIRFIEKNIEPYDVLEADEAFMTGTPFCVLPVSSLNGQRISKENMGSITKNLIDKWGKNVGVDIIKQIKGWYKDTSSNSPSPYKFK
jgi:branched-chain amino acid aminotransferase